MNKPILLHTCCAPCSCIIIERLLEESFSPTIFFYNPNVHPREEYDLRKASVKAFAALKQVPMVDADYDPEKWFEQVKGLEQEPERGRRCTVCFDLRLGYTAAYAYDHGFELFATTNGIARWKDRHQVDAAGRKAASFYPGLTYLDRNWRENGALDAAATITRDQAFYRQKYCGCVFSNLPPVRKGRSHINTKPCEL